MTVADGKAGISEGPSTSPSVSITMASTGFIEMVEGRLDPITTFMGGKLKVAGDMVLAMQLQNLL